MTFVVGVDGGGTHTRAVILNRDGEEIGRAEGPGVVVTTDAPAASVEAVARAVGAAAERAGVVLPAAMLWAGLAGAGRDRARALVADALSAKGLARRVHVATDAEAAFYDAFEDGPGILLIGGTGSIAWGRGESGALVRVGGWGQRIGDEGSGYAVGLSALRQVLHAHDGREPATAMSDAVVERCGASGAADLVEWVEAASKREVGALAPLVVAAAEAGDPAAIAILEGAVTALVGHVVAAAERTGPWQGPAPVVVWGGLLAEGGPLRSRVLRALERPGIHLREGRLDPPAGAARLALRGL